MLQQKIGKGIIHPLGPSEYVNFRCDYLSLRHLIIMIPSASTVTTITGMIPENAPDVIGSFSLYTSFVRNEQGGVSCAGKHQWRLYLTYSPSSHQMSFIIILNKAPELNQDSL